MFEDIHFQYENGALDPELWEGYKTHYGAYCKAPGLQTYWGVRRQIFRPAFRDFLDSLTPPKVQRIDAMVAGTETLTNELATRRVPSNKRYLLVPKKGQVRASCIQTGRPFGTLRQALACSASPSGAPCPLHDIFYDWRASMSLKRCDTLAEAVAALSSFVSIPSKSRRPDHRRSAEAAMLARSERWLSEWAEVESQSRWSDPHGL